MKTTLIEYLLLQEEKKRLFQNFQNNEKARRRKRNKARAIINRHNKDNSITPFGIDKVASPKYKIDYFRYYLEVYFTDLLREKATDKNNKIIL